jgi:hypothetical protein
MTGTRTRTLIFVALVSVAAPAGAQPAPTAHFDAALSAPQIELKFARLRDARELDVGRPAEWVYSFSDPDSAKVEALSLRLVRDGFHIVSLQAAEGVTTLRVARTELLTPGALARRNRELAKLAAVSGVRSYDGADVGVAR